MNFTYNGITVNEEALTYAVAVKHSTSRSLAVSPASSGGSWVGWGEVEGE